MKKNLLDSIDVRTPCSESWEEMTGNQEVRFCSHCSKGVYDLSAITRAKAEKLVRDFGGRLCVRYVKDSRGKVVTAPPLTQIKRQATIAASVLAASLAVSSITYAQGVPIKTLEPKNVSQRDHTQKDPQGNGNSVISGRVLDINEAVVVGTKVSLRNNENGEVRVTKSDGEGHYEFKNLESGFFGIEAVAPGFATFVLKDIEIAEDSILEKDLTLHAGTVGELIIIEGPIETTEPEIESKIQLRKLIDLPRPSRTFTLGLFGLSPDASKTDKKANKKKKTKNNLPK